VCLSSPSSRPSRQNLCRPNCTDLSSEQVLTCKTVQLDKRNCLGLCVCVGSAYMLHTARTTSGLGKGRNGFGGKKVRNAFDGLLCTDPGYCHLISPRWLERCNDVCQSLLSQSDDIVWIRHVYNHCGQPECPTHMFIKNHVRCPHVHHEATCALAKYPSLIKSGGVEPVRYIPTSQP
jgi:hypothetical protein